MKSKDRQNLDVKNDFVSQLFTSLKQANPERLDRRLTLSWSNWCFGLEDLPISVDRLKRAGLLYIELHGNHYGADIGYKVDECTRILSECGVSTSGVCGMFSVENDMSSPRPSHRQAAIDYVRRESEFTEAMGGDYLLLVPAAVGRPRPYDQMELDRSVQCARVCADLLQRHGVRGAVEPIRCAETSLVHTVDEAQRYIKAVDSPAISLINGDVYHMQTEEAHIAEAILKAGEQLVNLHFADSNRGVLGGGSLDVKTIIKALYVIHHNREGRYVTFEPLGPGGDPYPAMYGRPDPAQLDKLVMESVSYFRRCEESVLAE